MKKRAKLFTTIASLCMAVALMAFGVYAATTISTRVTSAITFTSTDIAGDWHLTVAGGTYNGEYKTEKAVGVPASVDGATNKNIEVPVEFTKTANQITYTLRFAVTGSNKVAYTKVTAAKAGTAAARLVVTVAENAQPNTSVSKADTTWTVIVTVAEGFDYSENIADDDFTLTIDAIAQNVAFA